MPVMRFRSRRLEMHQHLVSTKNDIVSVSRLFTSRGQDVIFDQIVQATFLKNEPNQ